MSSYGMCPYVLGILHRTRFWYKRCGFAVININIISFLVVKNVYFVSDPVGCTLSGNLSVVMEMRASSV